MVYDKLRNIDLVIAADCDVVSKLLARVPLTCANLPPDQDHFVQEMSKYRMLLEWKSLFKYLILLP